MRKFIVSPRPWLIVLAMIVLTASSVSAAKFTQLIGSNLKALGLKPGDARLCVLTNAPYVNLNGRPAVGYVDRIQAATGCSVGRVNLLFYHRPVYTPPRVVLFRKDTGDAAVLTAGPGGGWKALRVNLSASRAIKVAVYRKLMKLLGPADAFSFVSITDTWSRGAPYYLLKSVELHNHLCPGVFSGYLTVRIIMKKYPLKKGQQYIWIACPPKCGDDAIQTMLDLTPGKRGMFVKQLTLKQRQKVVVERKSDNVQGILVIWDKKLGRGRGLVVNYNWGKLLRTAGVKQADFRPPGGKKNPLFFITRFKCNRAGLSFNSRPEQLVTVVREVPVTAKTLLRLTQAGVNPYQVIGLTR
jgi:formylmethanofuran dehydrogenase subunit E-like metal-binding protein